MSLAIESSVLELKSGLKLEFKDDETVKVLRVSTTESKYESKLNIIHLKHHLLQQMD